MSKTNEKNRRAEELLRCFLLVGFLCNIIGFGKWFQLFIVRDAFFFQCHLERNNFKFPISNHFMNLLGNEFFRHRFQSVRVESGFDSSLGSLQAYQECLVHLGELSLPTFPTMGEQYSQ